jgi:hypothetical protein
MVVPLARIIPLAAVLAVGAITPAMAKCYQGRASPICDITFNCTNIGFGPPAYLIRCDYPASFYQCFGAGAA